MIKKDLVQVKQVVFDWKELQFVYNFFRACLILLDSGFWATCIFVSG